MIGAISTKGSRIGAVAVAPILTPAEICTTYGLDSRMRLAALESKNIKASGADPLRDIAERHGMGPLDLPEAMKSAAVASL